MHALDSSSTQTPTVQSADLPSKTQPPSAAENSEDDWLDPAHLKTPEAKAHYAWRLQAARRLREALCSVPFYAKGAQDAKERGDEMAYWLSLQGSEATLVRR